MKKVTIYTDGSSLGNPGPSGWCALLEYKKKDGEFEYAQISGGEPYNASGRMELKAVVEGIKILKEACDITIITDSKYVADSIEIYLPNWIKKGFKDVKHTDLWGEYVHLTKNHQVKSVWIKAHNGHKQNEHCDEVAKANAATYTSGLI